MLIDSAVLILNSSIAYQGIYAALRNFVREKVFEMKRKRGCNEEEFEHALIAVLVDKKPAHKAAGVPLL